MTGFMEARPFGGLRDPEGERRVIYIRASSIVRIDVVRSEKDDGLTKIWRVEATTDDGRLYKISGSHDSERSAYRVVDEIIEKSFTN